MTGTGLRSRSQRTVRPCWRTGGQEIIFTAPADEEVEADGQVGVADDADSARLTIAKMVACRRAEADTRQWVPLCCHLPREQDDPFPARILITA